MTIAEEQIKRLAQEAHAFGREAHSIASVLESKLEQFEEEHLPQIKAALSSVTDAKNTIDNSSGLVKALAEGLNSITAEVKALRDDFKSFADKYIPMIEEAFVKTHSAQIAEETPSQIVTDTTAETFTDTATSA